MNGQAEIQSESGCVQNANLLIGIEKRCPDCGEVKPINEFYNKKIAKDKHHSQCKRCMKFFKKLWAANNRERIRVYDRSRYKINPREKLDKNKLWRKANPEKFRRQCLDQRKKHSHRIKEWYKGYYAENREKIKQNVALWAKNNPEKRKAQARKVMAKKLSTINGHLTSTIKGSIYKALKENKKRRRWETLVGYTIEQLKQHLEKQFKEGMTWNNYGKYGWHIDHIIPISAFNFEKPEDDDFKRCWALKNLQPLWAKENLIKQNKIDRHFQPNLIFK